MTTNILPTDNGSVFNILLTAGYCFAMCVDMSKHLLTFQKQNKPKRLPTQDDLYATSFKWPIVQSAYEKSVKDDREIIEGQGLRIQSSIPTTPIANFGALANAITSITGTTVFGIMGTGGGHELMWHRDDANSIWLYLDPNDGLYQFNTLAQAAAYISNDLQSNYSTLNQSYDAFTLQLES
jgi:hypothetical protein